MNLRGRGRRNARVTGGRRGGEKRGEEDRGRKGNALRKDGGRREDGYTRITPPARGVFVHVLGLADDRHAPDQPRRNSVGRVGARATARRSSALLLSSSATVNDDHLPIHFYSLLSLSLSDYYFANHPKCPFLSLLAPALRSISIQRVSLIIRRWPCRLDEAREQPFEASNEKEYFFFFFFHNRSQLRAMVGLTSTMQCRRGAISKCE